MTLKLISHVPFNRQGNMASLANSAASMARSRRFVPSHIEKMIPRIEAAWRKYGRTPEKMTDRDWMLLAFGEALKSSAGWGKVGAILVKDGKIIGKGGSIGALRIHAELDALKNAGTLDRPEKNEGATLYVTYQPCDFRDRTVHWHSCSDYIVSSGVKSVVFAGMDPRVGEPGLDKLKEAGVDIRQIDDMLMQSTARDVFNLRDLPIPDARNLP